jgi:hypothetical protein
MGNKNHKWHVYNHELVEYDDDAPPNDSYNADPFDIDAPVDTIEAFVSKSYPTTSSKRHFNDRVQRPKDKWFNLDQMTNDLWDQIDDKYKSDILGYMKSSADPPSSGKLPGKPLTLITISTSMKCLPMTFTVTWS